MGPPCLWDKGPPPPSDLNGKVYEGIHTLPPLDLNPRRYNVFTYITNVWGNKPNYPKFLWEEEWVPSGEEHAPGETSVTQDACKFMWEFPLLLGVHKPLGPYLLRS
jgi:hypothetical protein